jgi:hypothetical protein
MHCMTGRCTKGFPAFALAGALAIAGLSACSGSIGDGSMSPSKEPSSTDPGDMGGSTKPPGMKPPGPGDTTTPPDDKPPVIAPTGVKAGAAPLRRLNADQYANTIRDLFGFDPALKEGDLPPDEAVSDERFLSNVSRPVQGTDLDLYASAAQAIATKAVANLQTLMTCDPAGANEQACVTSFIRDFGKRIYRRPLTAAEQARTLQLFTASKGPDTANGVRVVLQAMLQSVNFLYLFEFASPSDAGKIVQVDSWAMASRLSYFFLGSMPDQPLFAAADAGTLSTADQVTAQARRLAATPAFLKTVQGFHVAWLQLDALASIDKDPMVFATWNEPLRAAMIEEPSRFVAEVMRTDGKLDTLLTAPFSVLNSTLATFYGASGGPAGDTWQKVALDPKQRAGLYTQAGLLSTLAHENRTSYILRGKSIREGLLCTKLPDPPAGVDTNETNIPPTADARTRSKLHSQNPSCAGCHTQFDPLGFAFENYDAIGHYRTTENGMPIDAHGDISGTERLDGTVANAVELMTKLGTDDEARHCVALQWTRFALGRDVGVDNKPETLDDLPSVDQAMVGFKAGGWKITDLVAAIATTDSFRYQKVKP